MLLKREIAKLGTVGLVAAALAAGCASPPPPDGSGPGPGDINAGNPEEKPTRKPDPARNRPAPEHPPDEQPAGNPGEGPLDQLHREMTLHEKEQKALAEHYFKVGKQLYDQFDYAEAAKNFAHAAEADPNDKKVQQYLTMAKLLAGDRTEEFKGVTEQLREARTATIDQQVIELKRIHDEGARLLEAREWDKAIVRFEQVLEKIRWFPYPVNDASIEKSARENIIVAKKGKRDQELADRVAREERALKDAQVQEQQAIERRKAQIQKLIRDGVELLDQEKYDQAEATFADILERDPGNDQAIKFRQIAAEGRHLKVDSQNHKDKVSEEFLEDLNETKAASPDVPDGRTVTFPDKDFWVNKVLRREIGTGASNREEPVWIQEYKKKLASQKVSFNFPGSPLSEVVTFLQDITGLNITVSKTIDQEQTKINLRLKEVVLDNALKIILDQVNLAKTFKNETLMIVPKEEAKGDYYLEIYDVQDILAAIPDFPGPRLQINTKKGGGSSGKAQSGGTFNFDTSPTEETTSVIEPDKLVELIKSSTGAEEAWGDPASGDLHRGQVIVNQTAEVHAAIRRVLQNLRRNIGQFVQVETRFLLLHNDFLQDIGVDYRNLGSSDQGSIPAVPIWGTRVSMDPYHGAHGDVTNPSGVLRGGGNGADEIGFGPKIVAGGNAGTRLGPTIAGVPLFGSTLLGGRTQNVLDGGDAYFAGSRLDNGSISGSQTPKGLAWQSTILDPFQVNAIVRAEEERSRDKTVTAPLVVAANRQRVHISAVTQRAYISDWELTSGGTAVVVVEVAAPIIQTIQEGVVLDVRPTISADRRYVTIDCRSTLGTLKNPIKAIPVNLGSADQAALNVPIEVPELTLDEGFTSVLVPDGGTALVAGFRNFNEKQQRSGVPFLDNVPFVNVLFKRDAELRETESLIILMTARIIILRDQEKKHFNTR